MFKKITVLLMLVITLFVFGCTPKKQTHLEYQTKSFECLVDLKINNEDYSIKLSKTNNDNYKITYTAPETVSGITIEKNNEGLFFSVGNVHIPIKNQSNITAETIKLFNLSKTDLISTKKDMFGGVKVKISDYKCNFGNVKLYLSDETNLPLRIEASINGNSVIMSLSKFEIIE
jgi:hypothetical protein